MRPRRVTGIVLLSFAAAALLVGFLSVAWARDPGVGCSGWDCIGAGIAAGFLTYFLLFIAGVAFLAAFILGLIGTILVALPDNRSLPAAALAGPPGAPLHRASGGRRAGGVVLIVVGSVIAAISSLLLLFVLLGTAEVCDGPGGGCRPAQGGEQVLMVLGPAAIAALGFGTIILGTRFTRPKGARPARHPPQPPAHPPVAPQPGAHPAVQPGAARPPSPSPAAGVFTGPRMRVAPQSRPGPGRPPR